MPFHPAGWRSSRIVLTLLLAGAAFAAAGQPYVAKRGDLVLQSSTVTSRQIDAQTAKRHGIQPAPNRGVLNVVLMRGPERRPIPADVSAVARTLAGVRRTIDLREVRENDRISYVGTYDFVPKEVLEFEITAEAREPDKSRPLTLSYSQQMWQSQ